MTLGQFILLGNWILEFRFFHKWKLVKTNPLLFPIVGLFFLHALGLLWTTDMSYGIKDITTKLPLLSIPIILATTKGINPKEWKGLLVIYWATSLIITLVSLMKFLAIGFEPVVDKRELSVYISHIRYGLNLAFLVILLLYSKDLFKSKWTKIILLASVLWFVFALSIFELMTGLVCLILVGVLRLLIFVFRKKNSLSSKIGFLLGFVIVLGVVCFQTYQISQDYYTPRALDFDQYDLIDTTLNGTPYIHNLESRKENGVLIYHFFAFKELRKEWEKVSSMNYKAKDNKGNPLFYTLLRYMSSKGLKKDSLGFSKLSKQDISAIENGIANVYYTEHNPIQNRIYQTFYEIDQWKTHGALNGYSLIMRLEYWKTAWNIIKKNALFGVGTGDVKQKMNSQYVIDNSRLDKEFRKRAHNQFLTFWLALGIAGLVLFLLILFYPLSKSDSRLLYGYFVLILAVSCLMEDTFETQAGITFSVLFYALILYGFKRNQESADNV